MPRLVLLAVLVSGPVLAASREPARTARLSHARVERPLPVEPAVTEQLGLVGAAGEGVDLAGVLGMATALGATFVYARRQRR